MLQAGHRRNNSGDVGLWRRPASDEEEVARGMRSRRSRSELVLTCGDAFDAALAEAKALRGTAARERHAESSRSHAVCDLVCANGGRLRVVDLAGSERLRAGAAGTDDARLREARDINASLACLTECLRARRGAGSRPARRRRRGPGVCPQGFPYPRLGRLLPRAREK